MMYYTQTKSYHKGFSLVETLVAIAILLIVIVGPMSIATNAANSTSFANQQVIAYFLAQEGLELAQKGRDDFLLDSFDAGNPEGSDVAWNDFTDDSSSGDFEECFNGGCGLEIGDLPEGDVVVRDCSSAADCRLYLSNSSSERSRYTYDTSPNVTDFTRVITMQQIPLNNGKDVLVTSEVTWRTGNQIAIQSTTATTYLYNTYGR